MGNNLVRNGLVDALPELRNYALFLTNDEQNAKELLQETSVRILYKADKYKEDRNLKGWMATIMYNLYINDRKRAGRQYRTTNETVPEIICHHNYMEVSDILCTLKSLSKNHRKSLQLFVAGYKYNEIAERLNLPIGTVKSRIHFARTLLLKAFDK